MNHIDKLKISTLADVLKYKFQLGSTNIKQELVGK